MAGRPRVGILALQGGVREHAAVLQGLGADVRLVRRAEDLDAVDALVLPGGESSVIDRLARTFGVADPIRERIRAGMPVYGTCAGMILLADRIEGAAPGQQTFGGIDVTVRRNAFGGQRESFDADLSVVGVDGPPVAASFIRAPLVTRVGAGVQVLASLDDGEVVAVRSGALLATSFHPEVSGDARVHRMFLEQVG